MKRSNNENPQFSVPYQDDHMIIVDKPAGLAVQSQNKRVDLETTLSEKTGIQVHPITRLDQVVSGLVIFAKSKKAAALFSRIFKEKKINKTYLAVVEGVMTETNSEILLKHNLIKIKNKALICENGDESELSFKVVRTFDNYSLLEVHTETGRFHQIRCQLQAIGHSIKGDIKYGAKRTNKIPGIMLHCYRLAFAHPVSGEYLDISSPVPDNINWSVFNIKAGKFGRL